MADIKTRDAVRGTIKTLDKAAVASERMKSAYAKTKEKAEEGYFSEESSPSEYAGNRLSSSAERVTKEGIHQFDKQGRKGVRETKENIIKAKDKIASGSVGRRKRCRENRQAHRCAMVRHPLPLPSRPGKRRSRQTAQLRGLPEKQTRRSKPPLKARSRPPRKP